MSKTMKKQKFSKLYGEPFPVDFYPNTGKPYPPRVPSATVTKYPIKKTLNLGIGDVLYMADLDGIDSIEINDISDSCDNTVSEVELKLFCKDEEVPNPNYEKEIADYKKKISTYRHSLKEWNKLNKLYKSQEKKRHEDREKEMYETLKKKFETQTPSG